MKMRGSGKLLLSAIALLIAAVAAPVHAEPATVGNSSSSSYSPDDDYDSVREFWTRHGVAADVQDTLIEKHMKTGEIDAFSEASLPVQSRVVDTEEVRAKIDTFADGSIHVSSVERPTATLRPGAQVPQQITNCSVTAGSGWATYSNCLVVSSTGFKHLQFRATYEMYQGAANKILYTHTPSANSNLGNMTEPTRTAWRPQATSTQNGLARYTSVFTSYNRLQTETIHLSIWLPANGAAYTSRS